MSWTSLIIICLGVCLIWELDERQTIKKHKKKNKIESSDDSLSEESEVSEIKKVKKNTKKENLNHLLDSKTQNLLNRLPEGYLEEAPTHFQKYLNQENNSNLEGIDASQIENQLPQGFDLSQLEGMSGLPEGIDMSQFQGQLPQNQGIDLSQIQSQLPPNAQVPPGFMPQNQGLNMSPMGFPQMAPQMAPQMSYPQAGGNKNSKYTLEKKEDFFF
jgi:hypothetical protein